MIYLFLITLLCATGQFIFMPEQIYATIFFSVMLILTAFLVLWDEIS